jgi:hypothetical protein
MPDASLCLLLEEVRGKTLRILRAVPPEHALWAPPGLQNHITWHAGHCHFVTEWLTMAPLGRPPRAPRGWPELFSWGSRPDLVPPDRWPSLAAVVARLEDQWDRLREVIGGLTPEQLDGPSARDPSRTVRSSILHGLHDEACHGGEIYSLLKLRCRSPG